MRQIASKCFDLLNKQYVLIGWKFPDVMNELNLFVSFNLIKILSILSGSLGIKN